MVTQLTYNYNRTINRGDSDKFRILFTKKTQVNGLDKLEPIDITGWTIRFTVRTESPESTVLDDKDALIAIEGILTDPKNGVSIIYVPAEITTKLNPGVYYYDIQYIKPLDGFGLNEVRSIRKAKYTILGDITRDNSYVVDGGKASDFKGEQEPLNENETQIIFDPCDGYNGSYAFKEAIIRMLDGGNAQAEKPAIPVIEKETDILDSADDGYEI